MHPRTCRISSINSINLIRRLICQLLHLPHRPMVRLLMPKSLEAPGPTMVFLVDVVVMVCGCTEDEAFSILDAIVCTKGALIYKHKGKWLCGDHSATSHVIMQLPLTSKHVAGQHCESVIRMEVAAAFGRYLSSCH